MRDQLVELVALTCCITNTTLEIYDHCQRFKVTQTYMQTEMSKLPLTAFGATLRNIICGELIKVPRPRATCASSAQDVLLKLLVIHIVLVAYF